MGAPIKFSADNQADTLKRRRKDIKHNQFIRELTHNSMEAIRAYQKEFSPGLEYKGEIRYYPRTDLGDSYGPKLAFGDAGGGFRTAPLLYQYMSELYAGEKGKNLGDKNIGIGAKDSTIVDNPEGVLVETLAPGEPYGWKILIHFDETSNQYELADLNDEYDRDQYQRYVLDADIQDFPDFIQNEGHGTVFTLLGKFPEEDTTNAYAYQINRNNTQTWCLTEINERYWDLPEGITIRQYTTGIGKNGNEEEERYDTAISRKQTAERLADKVYSKEYPTARLDIFVYPKKDQRPSPNSRENNLAFTGLVLDNEVFDLQTHHKAHSSILSNFGVHHSAPNISMVFHLNQDDGFYQDSFRKEIRKNGEKVTLATAIELQNEVHNKGLPADFKEYLDNIEKQNTSALEKFNPMDLLKPFKNLLTDIRQLKTKNGEDNPDDFGIDGPTSRPWGGENPWRPKNKRRVPKVINIEKKKKNRKKSKNKSTSINDNEWKYQFIESGSDLFSEEELEGQIGIANVSMRKLFIKQDSEHITSLVDWFNKKHSVPPQKQLLAKEAVEESVVFRALEYAMAQTELTNRKDAKNTNLEELLSPDILTGIVRMPHAILEDAEKKYKDKTRTRQAAERKETFDSIPQKVLFD